MVPFRSSWITPLGSQASSEDDAMFNGKIDVMEAYMGEDEAASTSIKKAITEILCRDYNVQPVASRCYNKHQQRREIKK